MPQEDSSSWSIIVRLALPGCDQEDQKSLLVEMYLLTCSRFKDVKRETLRRSCSREDLSEGHEESDGKYSSIMSTLKKTSCHLSNVAYELKHL